MRIDRIKLENWRNFRKLDVSLAQRAFIIGPNASGKSNLLDAFRLLKAIADPEGGFQRAVADRGGVSQIRCLHARKQPSVGIEVHLMEGDEHWSYRLEFAQDSQRTPQVRKEVVTHNGKELLSRPNENDEQDPARLTQTHLEQVNVNQAFRVVAAFLGDIRYMHIIPQLIRDSDRVLPRQNDPYGTDFLEQLARTKKPTLKSRLRRINEALQGALPYLKDLTLEPDEKGVPHLRGRYDHWRQNAGWQTEEQFSDGTLRLMGLLWAFLDGNAPLLLEEPELSLHPGVVRTIPGMMARVGRRQKEPRQVFVSTHSQDLLSDEGIAPDEVILLTPTLEGTEATVAVSDERIRRQMDSGISLAEIALARTTPRDSSQLTMFGAP
ncbi:MAG: AAA family ATPase [Longimicrobiales bacterium]